MIPGLACSVCFPLTLALTLHCNLDSVCLSELLEESGFDQHFTAALAVQ